MQKINLLPADLAPAALSGELILLIRKTALVLGSLILLFFLVWFVIRIEIAREGKVLAKMMDKVKESDLLSENIEDLKKRQVSLKQELAGLSGYLSSGLVWSSKLKQISAFLPPEVGLSAISFVRMGQRGAQKEALNLKGFLVPIENIAPINTLSAFVSKMKQDKEFFSDFNDLLISQVTKLEKSDIEAGYSDPSGRIGRVERVKVDIMAFEISLVIK
ncbi:MAG: hypothetical protein Q8L26_05470 [Candidatus Omnitrophota bacterium]|nr:hypothetical protein [Candidatus Omnitrophota bacterium]